MWRTFFKLSVLCVASLGLCSTTHAQQERVAVFVGVNEYPKPGFTKLRYAERDVELAAAEFAKLGFRTVVMKGSLPADSPLRATRANIVKQIETLMEPLDGDDLCVVMLSGHGHQFKPEGSDKEDAFYCPVDAVKTRADSMLSLSFVIDTLLDPHVGHKLLLVDACRDEPKNALGNKGIQGSDKISLPSKTSVFFSCSAKEQSFETDQLGNGMGTFAYCLLNGLRGEAANKDGLLTWSGLVAHVENQMESDEVRKLAPRQQPVMAGNAGRVLLGKLASASPSTKPLPKPIPSSTTPTPPSTSGIAAGKVAGERLVVKTGGIDLPLRWCPAGSFTMGSPKDEEGRSDDEDQVSVTLTRGYWLGETEVTQGLWLGVMGTKPWDGKEYMKAGTKYPATYVNWEDAGEFCLKLTERERQGGRLSAGWSYRLPSEAEWEYGCRAGTTGRYNGDGKGVLTDYAWYDANAWGVGEKYAHEVGLKKSNGWGLLDMHGNVLEWCEDLYGAKLPGGRDPVAKEEGSDRVSRGGGWFGTAGVCRSALRGRYVPSNRAILLGFRLALSPSGE
jgi:formylglycine-generating enzyme required for sulfatase activity